MKNRTCLLAVSLLVLSTSGAATSAYAAKAKPKPVCNLMTDVTGDAEYNGAVPGADGDDVVSGDVASDAKTITGVIRTVALAANDPQAPFGRAYFVEFGVKGAANTLFLSARTYPTGTQFVYGYRAADPTSGINTSYTIGAATGVVDTEKKEVRISAPNSGFAPAGSSLTKGSKLLALTATTWRMAGQGVVPSQEVGGTRVPVGGLLLPFDDGAGNGYTVGTPSCVKPGA